MFDSGWKVVITLLGMMPAVGNDGQKENLSQISTAIPFALCVNIKTRNKWESLKQQK